jgi:hypothetical protein
MSAVLPHCKTDRGNKIAAHTTTTAALIASCLVCCDLLCSAPVVSCAPSLHRSVSASFFLLTDLCAQCVEEGMFDVYQMTQEQLTAETGSSHDVSRPQSEALSERWRQGAAAAPITSIPSHFDSTVLPSPSMEFVCKDSADSSVVRGPYTATELVEATLAGELQLKDAVVRQVGSTSWTSLKRLNWLTSRLAISAD